MLIDDIIIIVFVEKDNILRSYVVIKGFKS